LKAPNYNSPVDIFALGLIMAELYLLNPIFPGESEIDQIYKICGILGTPPESWAEGHRLANQRGFSFPQFNYCTLGKVLPNASESALNIMKLMLTYDPSKRITASQILRHPFFADQHKKETKITNVGYKDREPYDLDRYAMKKGVLSNHSTNYSR